MESESWGAALPVVSLGLLKMFLELYQMEELIRLQGAMVCLSGLSYDKIANPVAGNRLEV
jgi:hypothetical protein